MTSLGRPGDDAAAGEVDDPVEVAQDRVDVVRDEQHRDALGAADAARAGRRPRPGSGGRGCRAARRGAAARAGGRAPGRSAGAAARRPSSSPIGRSRVGRARRRARSTSCDPLASAPRGRRAGSGSPQRSPSRPSRTRSTPRIRVDGVEARAAAAGSRSRALRLARGRAEDGRACRRRAAAAPRSDSSSVDLPAPLGPSTATNSPASTRERRRRCQTPCAADARRPRRASSTTDRHVRSSAGRLVQRRDAAAQLGGLPVPGRSRSPGRASR